MNRNLSAIVLIIISVGVYFTLTKGLIESAQAVRLVNAEYSSALTHAAQLTEARDELLKQYIAISDADRARLGKMIPNSVDNIRLVIDLNSLARQHGFSLTGVTAAAASANAANSVAAPSTPTALVAGAPGPALAAASIAAPVLDTITVSFGATAGYDQFIDFLQAIEANLRIMDLTHLAFSPAGGNTYTFSVQFQTYWLRQ